MNKKKRTFCLRIFLSLLFLLIFLNPVHPVKFEPKKIFKFPFFVYSYKENASYFAISGYMGDVSDIKLVKIKDPVSKKNSLKIIYKPKNKKGQQGWAGIYWQYPANNWGNNPRGGYDLSKAESLFFYAKGETGYEVLEFKIGGITGEYGDSDTITTGFINLTRDWNLYKIDLTDKNLDNIIGGFGIIAMAPVNPNGVIFYINDIYYSSEKEPEKGFFMDYANYFEIEDYIVKGKKGNEFMINISQYEEKLFSKGKTSINKKAHKILDQVAQSIKKEDYKRVIITIYTFDKDLQKFDLDLSEKRAQSIYQFLAKKGIDKKRITYKVYSQKDKERTHEDRPQPGKYEFLIIRWKKDEEKKFKYHYFMGLDAFIKESYTTAIQEWNKALKIDPDNEDIKRRIKESKEKLKSKNN
ncbi:MAG: OmpA family protein [Spirochaetes bacterium]|nr:OmpA family protein [Spirochaetota bacterium]